MGRNERDKQFGLCILYLFLREVACGRDAGTGRRMATGLKVSPLDHARPCGRKTTAACWKHSSIELAG